MKKFTLLFLLMAGCAQNPATNKPAAVVNTPAASSTAAAPSGAGQKFAIDPSNSRVEFVGSKVTASHPGGFTHFKGEVNLVENDPTKSSVKVEIETKSIFADQPKLTNHLKGADFFDVEKYPTASFVSKSVAKKGADFEVTGDFTLHGVTKSISFPAKIAAAADKVTVASEFSIKRSDFGIVYKGMANDLIREEVLIKLTVGATPAK